MWANSSLRVNRNGLDAGRDAPGNRHATRPAQNLQCEWQLRWCELRQRTTADLQTNLCEQLGFWISTGMHKQGSHDNIWLISWGVAAITHQEGLSTHPNICRQTVDPSREAVAQGMHRRDHVVGDGPMDSADVLQGRMAAMQGTRKW